MSVNKVILIGNLGADPEIKTFDNGGMIANFRIATTERWKDKTTGEQKEQTDWHNIVVRQPGLAKVVQQYVTKGMSVCVIGKLRNRQYETNGEKKYITEVHCDELNMLGSKNQSTQQHEPAQPTQQQPVEDDLPF